MVGLPDMKQADVYESSILPNLVKGKTLLFSHGLAIHFGLIKLPKGVDCIMVAPKGPGHMVRRLYAEGNGMPALIAVAPGSAKTAKSVALGWAKGSGSTRAGVVCRSSRPFPFPFPPALLSSPSPSSSCSALCTAPLIDAIISSSTS